jgi:magnesium-transporting ATPase (P-type)
VLLVGPGDPVFADGEVIGKGQICVDESAVTGKKDRPIKRAGDYVYAGSFCVDGRVAYEAQKVGDERLAAAALTAERGTYTELTPLQNLMNRGLRLLLVVVAAFVIVFVGAYLFLGTDSLNQFFIDALSMAFGIAPSGLFFMFVITYAVSTASIAKLGAVIYRPQAIESLAYVDVLCLGKTSGLIGVNAKMELIDQPEGVKGLTAAQVRRALGNFAHSTSAVSSINKVIADTFSGERRPTNEEAPFFSVYGWSAVAFDETDLRGVYVLGEDKALEPFLMAESNVPASADGDGVEEEKSRLSAVTGFAGRLAGRLRRREEEEKAEVDGENQRLGGDTPTNPGELSSNEERAALVSPDQRGEADNEPTLAEDKGVTSHIGGLFRRVKMMLPRREKQHEEASSDEAQEDRERELIRLLFAYVPDVVPLQDTHGTPKLPKDLVPLCHVRLVEYVREEAVTTIQAFAEQGVAIKLLTDDRTEDVAAVAKQAGLFVQEGTLARAISGPELAGMDAAAFGAAVVENTVFGDLMPEQMGEIVRVLSDQGDHVAMVGSGMNHMGALRNANLKITVQSGSQAALTVADIVLLDDSLAAMSQVLLSGQRIVNGLLDMLKLNLVQVFYLTIFLAAAIFIGFPYAPQHGSFIALLTLSLPSTGLSLWAASGTVPSRVMRDRVVHFALPAGLTVSAIALGVHFLFRETTGDVAYAQLTTAYIVTACGLLLVVFVQPPTRAWVGGDVLSGDRRPALLVLLLSVLFIVASFIRLAQHFLHVAPLRRIEDYVVIAVIAALWALGLRFIWRVRPLERFERSDRAASAMFGVPSTQA